jgi:hypothetical protein
MANSNYLPSVVTPFCTMKFMYLAKQDTKFDPKYSVDMVFDTTEPSHREFIEQMQKLNKDVAAELLKDQKVKKGWNTKELFKEETDSEGNPTGKLMLKGTTKDKPVVKDCDGKVLEDSFVNTLGNGTVGRAKLCLKKSAVSTRKTLGITTYLSTFGATVQVKEPVFYEGGDGFGKVEDGFVAPEITGGDEDF